MNDAESKARFLNGRCCFESRRRGVVDVYVDSRGLTVWCRTHDKLIGRLTPETLGDMMEHAPDCECCKARQGAVS